MKGLSEVLAEHEADVTSCDAGDIYGCGCGWEVPDMPMEVRCDGGDWDAYRAHLTDVVLAWVAAGLDGAREDVWEWLPYSKIPEASDADAVLDIIRGALGVPQEATGADLSDEERSVGFGDGSDDEGGLE